MAFFRNYRYTTNSGATIQTRISNHTVAAQTTAPTQGPATLPGTVSFGISSRRRDFRGRFLTLKRTVGTGQDAKTYFTRLGVLLLADFNGAPYADGATVQVNGVDWIVSSRTGESLK